MVPSALEEMVKSAGLSPRVVSLIEVRIRVSKSVEINCPLNARSVSVISVKTVCDNPNKAMFAIGAELN